MKAQLKFIYTCPYWLLDVQLRARDNIKLRFLTVVPKIEAILYIKSKKTSGGGGGGGNHTPSAVVRPRVNFLTRSKWQSQFIHIEGNTPDIDNKALFLAKV